MDINSIAEGLKVTGRVHLVKTNKIGQIIEERDVPNLVLQLVKITSLLRWLLLQTHQYQ